MAGPGLGATPGIGVAGVRDGPGVPLGHGVGDRRGPGHGVLHGAGVHPGDGDPAGAGALHGARPGVGPHLPVVREPLAIYVLHTQAVRATLPATVRAEAQAQSITAATAPAEEMYVVL